MLDHPAIIAVAIPMAIAVVVAAIVRSLGHQGAAPHVLSLGGLAGFLAAYIMLVGWPDGLPRTATQKLGYIALAGIVAGIVLDILRRPMRPARLVFLLPVAAVLWIIVPRMLRYVGDDGRGVADWAPLLIAVVLAAAVLWRLTKPEGELRDGRLAQLIAASFGLGGVCILGSSASLGLLAFAVGAVGAGVAIWNLGRLRVAASAGLVLALGAVFSGLAVQAGLFSRAELVSLLTLLLCFGTDLVPALRPMATPEKGFRIVASAAPYVLAAIAVGLAVMMGGGDDPY